MSYPTLQPGLTRLATGKHLCAGSAWSKRLGLIALLGAPLLTSCGTDEPSSQEPERPIRIVLVTLDTLRLDAFDGPDSAMPQVRAWADRGRVFDQYYSVTSTTRPTHATLFTGLYPWEHGLTSNAMSFSRQHETVAEILSDEGFETAAVVASFPLHGVFGFDQGFELYVNEFGEEGEPLTEEAFIEADGDDDEGRNGHLHSEAERILERSLTVLDGMSEGNQFLWFHFFDPHAPYGDSLKTAEESAADGGRYTPARIFRRLKNGRILSEILAELREFYDADVRYLDAVVAQLLERIDADAEQFETHVIIVSDHGEALGDAGSIGHGKRLLDCLIRVPLAIVSPRVEAGRSEAPAGSVDVAATLLALAGIEGRLPRGRDLTGELAASAPVYGMRRTFEQPTRELRTDNRKHPLPERLFFAVRSGGYYTGDSEAVQLGDYPAPTVTDRKALDVRELFAGFQQQLEALEVEAIDDPELLKRLEALGYTE